MGGEVKTVVKILYSGLAHSCGKDIAVKVYSRVASDVPVTKEMAGRLIGFQSSKVGEWVIRLSLTPWEGDPPDIPIYDVYMIPGCSSTKYGQWNSERKERFLHGLQEEARFDFFVEKGHPAMTLEIEDFLLLPPETAAFGKNGSVLLFNGNFEQLLQPLFEGWFTGSFNRYGEDVCCYAPVEAVDAYLDPYTRRTIMRFFNREGKLIVIWHKTRNGNQHIHLTPDLPKENVRYYFRARSLLVQLENELKERVETLGEAIFSKINESLARRMENRDFGINLN